jgi:hypothetical protein
MIARPAPHNAKESRTPLPKSRKAPMPNKSGIPGMLMPAERTMPAICGANRGAIAMGTPTSTPATHSSLRLQGFILVAWCFVRCSARPLDGLHSRTPLTPPARGPSEFPHPPAPSSRRRAACAEESSRRVHRSCPKDAPQRSRPARAPAPPPGSAAS